jgi:hypothetical protein
LLEHRRFQDAKPYPQTDADEDDSYRERLLVKVPIVAFRMKYQNAIRACSFDPRSTHRFWSDTLGNPFGVTPNMPRLARPNGVKPALTINGEQSRPDARHPHNDPFGKCNGPIRCESWLGAT